MFVEPNLRALFASAEEGKELDGGEGIRVEDGLDGLEITGSKTEFLQNFTTKRELLSLVCLHFAAREFPVAAESFVRGALGREDALSIINEN